MAVDGEPVATAKMTAMNKPTVEPSSPYTRASPPRTPTTNIESSAKEHAVRRFRPDEGTCGAEDGERAHRRRASAIRTALVGE